MSRMEQAWLAALFKGCATDRRADPTRAPFRWAIEFRLSRIAQAARRSESRRCCNDTIDRALSTLGKLCDRAVVGSLNGAEARGRNPSCLLFPGAGQAILRSDWILEPF